MSNYLNGEGVVATAMATNQQSMGVDHPTVVPANFDPETAVCSDRKQPHAEH
jgi:hypothetical protein